MDVGAKGPLPFFVRDVADVFERGLVGRVVDEDVEASEIIDRLLDDLARGNASRPADRRPPAPPCVLPFPRAS